mmetsp:Transcript_110918/g.269567  ORF Transcript_110918/g.269567 Transcript_110918/m.269567 type:complete len:225 (-) Transcript_110918:1395-2069(-)
MALRGPPPRGGAQPLLLALPPLRRPETGAGPLRPVLRPGAPEVAVARRRGHCLLLPGHTGHAVHRPQVPRSQGEASQSRVLVRRWLHRQRLREALLVLRVRLHAAEGGLPPAPRRPWLQRGQQRGAVLQPDVCLRLFPPAAPLVSALRQARALPIGSDGGCLTVSHISDAGCSDRTLGHRGVHGIPAAPYIQRRLQGNRLRHCVWAARPLSLACTLGPVRSGDD